MWEVQIECVDDVEGMQEEGDFVGAIVTGDAEGLALGKLVGALVVSITGSPPRPKAGVAMLGDEHLGIGRA
jgi:hypothetical protein